MELLGGTDSRDHGQVQQHGQHGDDHQSHGNEHLLSDGLGSRSHTGFWGTVSDIHVFPVSIYTVEKLLVIFPQLEMT